MTNTNIIAIDGPAASGKGTLARKLAEALDYAHLDTGKLYRAVGIRILRKHHDPGNERDAVAAAQEMMEHFSPEFLFNPELGNDDVGEAASKASQFPGVRDALLQLQKNFAANPPDGKKGAVLDGRDIGTVVCAEAKIKIFIVADTAVRAQRRYKELHSKGIDVTYEAVFADMQRRDERDSGRDAAPLKPAEDAFVMDTTHLTVREVFERAMNIVDSAKH